MQAIAIILTTSFFVFGSVWAVEECYVCIDKCEELIQHKCTDDGFSHNIDLKCYTIEITTGDLYMTEKGCLPADTVDVACTNINQVSGTSCSVCDTDLCNGLDHTGTSSAIRWTVPSLVLVVANIICNCLKY